MLGLTSGWFLEHAWLVPLIPGIGFAVIILLGKRLPLKGSEIGLASMTASLVLSVGTAWQWMQRTDSVNHHESAMGMLAGFGRSVTAANGLESSFVPPVIKSWTWWSNGSIEFGLGQHVDGLSVMLLLLVSFISLLVLVFSLEYVRGDRRYTHFFGAMTLFSAGMLVTVVAENMVQLILGWEIMGVCSFMLIGHWWEEEPNARAALKAFLTVRVGDVGLLVGTAILFFSANTWTRANLGTSGFSISGLQAWALSGEASQQALLWAAVAMFIACIAKSGQFPLHTWLPDAMAGPTPVSSLLHSSTMVVAGVFLVARVYPVFWEGFDIATSHLNPIVVIAAITIVISGLLAFVQSDIKKVLAYSTVGQLGYMMLGLGAGAWVPAVFHIFTHAFFKCCLFLCAGSVSHSGSHHSFDMRSDMGGLARKMPITCGAWIVSGLALAGVFPLAGFFSKDEIIDYVGHNGYTTFMWIALVGAFLTAAYTTRTTYLTFFGAPRGAAAGEHLDDPADAHADIHDVPGGAGVEAEQFELEEDTIETDEQLVLARVGHDDMGDPIRSGVAAKAMADPDVDHGVRRSPDDVSDAPGQHDHGPGDHGLHEPGHVVHDGLHDHGDAGHEGHGAGSHGPKESPKLILVPVCILAFFAVVAGFANAAPFDIHKFTDYVAPAAVEVDGAGQPGAPVEGDTGSSDEVPTAGEGGENGEEVLTGCGHDAPGGGYCFAPATSEAEFRWSKAALSLGIAAAGIVVTWFVCIELYTRKNRRLAGLTERSKTARGGYAFLVNKYYLDALYEGTIVRLIAHPIARTGNWINQNVLDGVVNGAGNGVRRAGRFVYRWIDSDVVDGAVNLSGSVANDTGTALQPVQSGKVNLYGALLFGAAAVAAVVLVIVNA